MRREGSQLGFADHAIAQSRTRVSRRDTLVALDGLIDWSAVKSILATIESERKVGRPGYPVLSLFKALLLQGWYGLSDPGLEDALGDRVSFRRFVGLSWEDGTPDHSVISRFRTALAEHALDQRLFDEVLRQLDAKGMILRQGTLIDATLIAAAVAPPPRHAPGKGMRSARDPDARWTKKNGKATFGYKLHAAVDHGSQLIRDARLTSANVNDCVVGPKLVQGDERVACADMAYDNKTMRDLLTQHKIRDGIMRRPNKHHKLPRHEVARNTALGTVRGRIEGVFATLKRLYGRGRLRLLGMTRNRADLMITLTAINLRRALLLAS